MTSDLKTWLFFPKPVELMLFLLELKEPINQSRLTAQTSLSYSGVADIVAKFELKGLATTNSSGRCRHVSLTKKGEIVARHLKDIWENLKGG